MFYNSSSNTEPKMSGTRPSIFEVLVFCVGETWLVIRAHRIQRLMAYTTAAIKPGAPDEPIFAGLLGYFEPSGLPEKKESFSPTLSGKLARFPVLALDKILELPAPVAEDAYKQIICMEYNGGTIGFAIESALEIERANVADVRVLPSWVENSRTKPVVWALWQRSPDELLPLVEPLEAVSGEL
jgi:chemotaxis signal transduction protein